MTTKFKPEWLNQTDGNGVEIRRWCSKGKDAKKANCCACKAEFSIANSGIAQIKQHANTDKHKDNFKAMMPPPKNQTTLDSSTSTSGVWSFSDQVTEVIWTLKVANNDYSFNSCEKIDGTFKAMFTDSRIAENITLGRTKVSYLISDGLGPYVREQLIEAVKKSDNGFTIAYDETPNVSLKNQMDLVVFFWCHEKNCIERRYFDSHFLGHTTADIIVAAIWSSVEKTGWNMKNWVSLSSDGPHVTKAVWRLLNDKLKKEASANGFVDIGTCNLHIVNNAFGKGEEELTVDVDEFVVDTYYFFKSGARRQDFQQLQNLMEVTEHFFTKHCKTRWLTLVPAVQRAIEQLDVLKKFINEIKDRRVQKTGRFLRLRSKLNGYDLLPNLLFIQAVGPLFQEFLTLFQTQGPLIHILHTQLFDLVRKMMMRFVKKSAVEKKSARQIVRTNFEEKDILLSDDEMEIGQPTRKALEKVQKDKIPVILRGMRNFYIRVSKYLMELLPLKNQLLEDLSCLQPRMKENATSAQCMKRIAEKFPHVISGEEVSLVVDEFKAYQLDQTIKDTGELRADYYWRQLEEIKLPNGEQKYRHLTHLLRCVLTLAHGNADCERGFSTNARTLIKSRAQLADETVCGIRNIKSVMSADELEPQTFPFSKELLSRARSSNSAWKARLAIRKLDEDQAQVDKGGKEKSATKTDVKADEKKLKEREKAIMDRLESAEKTVKEVTAKLVVASKDGDMNSVVVATSMLDSTSTLLEGAKEELTQVRKEQEKIERKRRLVNPTPSDATPAKQKKT